MRKNKRNYKYFFHTMGLLFFLILLVILVANILLPNRNFSEKKTVSLLPDHRFNSLRLLPDGLNKNMKPM